MEAPWSRRADAGSVWTQAVGQDILLASLRHSWYSSSFWALETDNQANCICSLLPRSEGWGPPKIIVRKRFLTIKLNALKLIKDTMPANYFLAEDCFEALFVLRGPVCIPRHFSRFLLLRLIHRCADNRTRRVDMDGGKQCSQRHLCYRLPMRFI